jgi:glucose/arabinose dehydrogenase
MRSVYCQGGIGRQRIRQTVSVRGLEPPWGMLWLPDGTLLLAIGAGTSPLVWSNGHRKIQGLARDPLTGRVWPVAAARPQGFGYRCGPGLPAAGALILEARQR